MFRVLTSCSWLISIFLETIWVSLQLFSVLLTSISFLSHDLKCEIGLIHLNCKKNEPIHETIERWTWSGSQVSEGSLLKSMTGEYGTLGFLNFL